MQANSGGSGSGFEPEALIRSCTERLSRRDFTGAREFAHRINKSDPDISLRVDQILAVADVLTAAQPRPGSCHPDWPAVLQLRPADASNRDLARRQFKSLARLLDRSNKKLPFADDALMRVREAWLVLSNRHRNGGGKDEGPSQAGGGDASGESVATTFWTMCPYCWYLHEYEKKYEGCAFQCETCRRAFHGVAVKPPSPERMVEGKEQYYCYNVSFPLRYPMGDERCRFDTDDGIRDWCESGVLERNGMKGFQANGKRRMRIKTTAKRVKMKSFDPINDSA
ncbi:hypothetical protein PIB30_013552 [Stylosanthes scabra]|uniref:J domain-containing protein n=1 Tax=Stylosanthes scabra TaxID=79078 RepID=A0ABU6S6A7_9FABA|nr:hypothetical protein [Stylosanthes scabra]